MMKKQVHPPEILRGVNSKYRSSNLKGGCVFSLNNRHHSNRIWSAAWFQKYAARCLWVHPLTEEGGSEQSWRHCTTSFQSNMAPQTPLPLWSGPEGDSSCHCCSPLAATGSRLHPTPPWSSPDFSTPWSHRLTMILINYVLNRIPHLSGHLWSSKSSKTK